ncbi:4-hydroxy-tetrahydrodipicolinate reductase [Devosia sp.]|uniref:4-hydroxy-tetrahydrodipicolinate reductase n=1 Tax=Devosia sp. TaxID=1871048 RepID=UPI003262E565
MADLKVVIAGAGGRMGAANIRSVAALSGLKLHGAVAGTGLTLHAAVDRPGTPAIGQDAGIFAGIGALGVIITDDLEVALKGADAVIDFTAPAASVALAKRAAALGLVHVIGTTGCSVAEDAEIAAAAKAGAKIVKSGNYSMGIAVLASLVRQAAALLADYDIEVLEMHHNKKVDAPSGTALMLGKAAADGRDVALADKAVRVRDGHTGAREPGSIGFATLRGGAVVGDHTVMFAGPAERIELSHKAQDRSMFADGAARAALWAAGQAPGLYDMNDVLGLK